MGIEVLPDSSAPRVTSGRHRVSAVSSCKRSSTLVSTGFLDLSVVLAMLSRFRSTTSDGSNWSLAPGSNVLHASRATQLLTPLPGVNSRLSDF